MDMLGFCEEINRAERSILDDFDIVTERSRKFQSHIKTSNMNLIPLESR